MNPIKKLIRSLVLVCTLHCFLTSNIHAQLQFTSTKATEEGAIQLFWQSESNSVYRIEYSDELIDQATVWNILYDNYPSHGTNTFVADVGNYDVLPEILHPKRSPMRFYRVKYAETNTSPTNPIVAITFPTNGASLSSNVTIVVSSSSGEMLTDVQLYIDGQEQWASDDGTNFVINTCEWPNGSHILFAIAKSQSGLPGLPEDKSITYGRAVSAYVNVTFDNLITKFDFSELSFEPELGQTQHVTASFAANVNWTILVQDKSSNTVRSASGSGISMAWDFDGKDNGGTNLPPDLYSYLLTVQTNGQSFSSGSGGGGGGSGGPPSFNSSVAVSESLSEEWYPTSTQEALSAGLTSFFIPPPPLPPVSTNGEWHSWQEVFGGPSLIEVLIPEKTQGKFLQSLEGSLSASLESSELNAAQAFYGGSSQSTRGPTRKPKMGYIGKTGTFGMVWDTFPNGINCNPPLTGNPFPLQRYVKIDGNPVGTRFDAPAAPGWAQLASYFNQSMKDSGYKLTFSLPSDKWTFSTLTGANGLFNNVNLGFFITHGSYGETLDSQTVLNTYLWHNDGTYARLRDFKFGSPGTNGLRWMTIWSCSTLRSNNITSMANRGFLASIITEDLHLLLGAENEIVSTPRTGLNYGKNLVAGQTIPNAWFNALSSSLALAIPPETNDVVARVVGWNPCFSDTLHFYNDPDTSEGIRVLTKKVWPLP